MVRKFARLKKSACHKRESSVCLQSVFHVMFILAPKKGHNLNIYDLLPGNNAIDPIHKQIRKLDLNRSVRLTIDLISIITLYRSFVGHGNSP
jgi:hypothetical protein